MRCKWCRKAEATDIHHKIPRYAGGTDEPENLEHICKACHTHYHRKNGDFQRWGTLGGKTTYWKYGKGYMRAIAVKGGKKTGKKLAQTRGREYFVELGRKGGLARAKKLREKVLEWIF